MAQSLYDTSPSHSFQYYPNTTDPMHSPSAPFSQFHHNMMSNARSAPKQKLSRLELLRNDYNKKLQIERETKLNQLRVQVQQQNNPRQGSTRNGSGVVREFFAERRALEATRKGQKKPELLPPIDSHFKKLKEQKQGSTSTQGFVHDGQLSKTSSAKRKQTNLQHQASQLQQKPLPTKYSTPTKTKGVGHVRKRTKGIDKQDPLPPVNNGSSNAAVKKPPTPNKRYETHSVLEQDPNDVKDDDREQSGHAAYLPVPPIKSNPRIKRPRVPLPPPSNDAFSDQEDGQSTLTDNSNVAPNLSSLKAKALRQRQLSKQRLIASGHVLGGNAKMTDFQKWQTEQNKERDERLDRHRKVSEKSNEPLSQREQEILSKIEEEQTRLQKLKEQRQELEEQEKKQKEEDVKWLVQKQALEETTILPRQESNQDYTLTKATKPRITKPKQPAKPKTQPQRRMSALGSEIEESENIHDNSHHNFYAEQTQDIDVVSVDVSPCSICGRNFATDRLAKHEKVCAKNTASKRKVFNSTKQRNQGTDNEENVMRGKHREEPKKKPKVDWRAQHENFIKAIRYAKGASNEPPPPTENKDYIQCPHCERKFNPATAERHIPKCKDIKARPAPLKKKR